MKRMSIVEALREGIAQEMRRDERVFCIGEDIAIPGGWGGAFTVTLGLEKEFAGRMWNTPISEAGSFGVACGAALMGMRPIADVQYSDFLFCAMDQVASNIAKLRYMSGGKLTVPITMRAPVGVTGRGSQHAQNMETFFLPLPGVKIVCPATAYDALGLLRTAVRSDDPVMIFEHKLLYGSKGARAESGAVDASSDIPDEDYTVPLGKALVRREGRDVTIIATLLMMHRSLQAAELLEKEGISVEVIDPRSLVPFDWQTVQTSVAKTHRVVIVEESPKRSGVGAEIAATLAEDMFDLLQAPVRRVAAPNTPAPFSPPMESFYIPSVDGIISAVRETVGECREEIAYQGKDKKHARSGYTKRS
ncbi:MAG: alpha-ketoacid dehydrogenase subunit beta [Phycisphaerae bacterium]|nr:alpha-ketoacid dehydrogenase subunit beta [Phycisphaerae bacterium]